MVKILIWIVLLPLVLIVIALAVANHEAVVISLEPLPFRFAPPLYLLVLIFAFLGLLGGLLVGWTRGLRWRVRAGQAEREVARLEGELRREREMTSPPRGTGGGLPATIGRAA